jgi:uncharacterized surface protein with fasciclin (FAS1) repeats
MSSENRINRKIRPTHPGEMLREDFIPDYGLTVSGLAETLGGSGPFTIFAPTNAAFAKLPAGTVEKLLKDIPTLKNILLYHVVSGNVKAADVVKLTEAETVLGQKVTIKVDGNKVFINGSQVIITDIETSNGTIHVIDTVLLPK